MFLPAFDIDTTVSFHDRASVLASAWLVSALLVLVRVLVLVPVPVPVLEGVVTCPVVQLVGVQARPAFQIVVVMQIV